ncbi:hypothetical protein SPRG_10449 [Saprolegnia parasitica CBS 223.65]|uniref:Uncharacterized protein n=1 Tax=Saprolegnia parasitica (strain CBS 223.65) TaxID=695850 RepID=A0A067CCV4_SAPPC|nr:hypothetical protein SPRG_10449 [Saprolegnia parasitica CBS 223.65]KDO24371.1 hypothetical protein SPRG_10449 [Saprolegnia parasitica CBS 223.65]|eukprot:XP_012204964.1 hypothetical protein SPRG_10449 [Saprolegnia parasitica CBS 223.65]
MSLVADYSDSSDSDAETPVVVAPAAVVAAPCAAKPIALPSADDLFAGTVKPSSVSAGPSFLVQRPTPKPPTKRALDEPTVTTPTKNAKVKTRSLLPPQLRNRRPNVSTEDLSAWNTRQTMNHQTSSTKSQ